MADTTERPPDLTVLPAPAPELAPSDASSDEPYRPLSLLAVLGFSLAVLYAFLVLLGGLVPIATRYPRLSGLLLVAAPLLGAQAAILSRRRTSVAAGAGMGLLALALILGLGGLLAYSGSNPWLLLEGAGWLLALAAVGVCGLARSRIASSEGTLGGAGLAGWGLTISLCFGLLYGAYLASNTFAVRSQARQAAEQFLSQVQNDGNLPLQSFALLLPVRERPAGDLRRSIEVAHNVAGDSMGRVSGAFSRFRSQQYVQLLRMKGTRFDLLRADAAEFERGGYVVPLVYALDTPIGRYELLVTSSAQEVGDGTGRQWQVNGGRTTILKEGKRTPLGDRYTPNLHAARRAMSDWTQQVRHGDPTAYLGTLDASQRKGQDGGALLQMSALLGATGVGLPGAVGATVKGKDAFTRGIAEFRKGKLLDVSEFFTPTPEMRKQILAEILQMFQDDTPSDLDFALLDGGFPGFTSTGDEGEFVFPARIITRERGKSQPAYFVELDAVVVGPVADRPSPLAYRVTRLRLLRGLRAADPRAGPG